jgi:hypothetical protein
MLVYTMVYLATGELPWIPFSGKKSVHRKLSSSPLEICGGVPDVFHTIFVYIKSLAFEAIPDYTYLKDLMTRAIGQKSGLRKISITYKQSEGLV